MPATLYDYDPNKTVYQQFYDNEAKPLGHTIKCWRYGDTDNRDIHFAAVNSRGELFTAVAYTRPMQINEDGEEKEVLFVKVVEDPIEPLNSAVQRYYREHRE